MRYYHKLDPPYCSSLFLYRGSAPRAVGFGNMESNSEVVNSAEINMTDLS